MRKWKLAILTLFIALFVVLPSGCGGTRTGDIVVVSRESGSGTRGSFVDLFHLIARDGDNKKDMTTLDAIITSKTDVVLTSVSADEYAIGYVSVGSLSDTVKALEIDGIAATVEHIKDKSYKITRPFNIVTKGTASDLESDFISFILSREGQSIVRENNYVPVLDDSTAFTSSKLNGKLVIAGSTAVTPVMEKLKESYEKLNPDAKVEIQMTDSTSGIRALINGTCDIGMSSRELTPEEEEQASATVIAIDGIAVIVSKDNQHTGLTTDEVQRIFAGEITNWDDVQ